MTEQTVWLRRSNYGLRQRRRSSKCGCGEVEKDSDGDEVPDGDEWPQDPANTLAGKCDRGEGETDSDSDGVHDCDENPSYS
jgi:hypothetical protein